MEHFEILDEEIVQEIVSFIEKRKEKESLTNLYPNVILKSDVLQILERYCTVVYYPLPDGEDNNGFHISDIPGKDGENYHFVFINTHQTIDKQVFTGAHELGHVWKVDEEIARKFNKMDDDAFRENVANRFAAELLMPKKEFSEQCNEAIKLVVGQDKKISFNEFIKLVSGLMYSFLCPMKAVLRRMSELDFISTETVKIFISEGKPEFSDKIKKAMNRVAKEEGYTELYRPTEKKYIDGLVELLDKAEEDRLVSEAKIQHMRKLFDLPSGAREKAPDQQINYIEVGRETDK